MKSFLTILLFLSLPFNVKEGFPEGENGFDIKKIEELTDTDTKWYLNILEEIRRDE